MNAVEIAISMEADAIKFYKEAADRTSNPVGKKMFLAISDDEKRHLGMLSKIIKGLDIKGKDVSPMKNVKSIFETMKEDMMKKVETTVDELEAFKIAMQMEKEGIEFYKKAATVTSTEKEAELFKRLIQEEQQHYDIFANTYFYLYDSGSWFMWEEHSIVDGGTPTA